MCVLTELLSVVEFAAAVVCHKDDIVLSKEHLTVSNPLFISSPVSCEDGDQPGLPPCPPPGLPLCLLYI